MHVEEPMVLRAAARGLAGLKAEVIMTTCGRPPEALELGPPASNMHLVDWISHSDLLRHTDVVVTTGGAGTVLAALQVGVPLVIVPTGLDKPEIAQRVVEAGAGLRIGPRRCTPARLRAAVERVLGATSFRRNARRLSEVLAARGGPARAAELLEGLAARNSAGQDAAVPVSMDLSSGVPVVRRG
jgi:UDP:flavonoid glycosyltransferase YjiC (YdhE family)